MITAALKGLDNKYTLFHFTTPVSHLLVGPAGVWVLNTRHQKGTITFSKGRWRQRGGGFLQAYLRAFAQEGLGRPDLEVPADIDTVQKFITTKMPDGKTIPVHAALVFLNPAADIQVSDEESPPAVTLPISRLKEFMRKTAKTKPVSIETIALTQKLLAGETTPQSTESDDSEG
jgi:hypothetical protein